MPAGVPWPQYLKFFTASMISMMAGAQTVHHIYNPLNDLDSYVTLEMEKHKQTEKLVDSNK